MQNSAFVAYLPQNGSWCKQDFPHMSLIYAGDTEGRSESDFNALAKDAVSAARVTGSFSLMVTGVEEFGSDEKVDVLTFHPTPQLLVARNTLLDWDDGEFKDFKPHATIGPAGSALVARDPYADPYSDEVSYNKPGRGLPLSMYFNRIAVCWNDKKLIFNLNELY